MSYCNRNYEKNGIEIHLDRKPSAAVRDLLKNNGWRWSGYSKCWYNHFSNQNLDFAKRICGEKLTSSVVSGRKPYANDQLIGNAKNISGNNAGTNNPIEIIKTIAKSNSNNHPRIGMKDFVVRCNVFKCRVGGHKVQNIEAEVSLIVDKEEATIIRKSFSAGYCSVCKTYFIMQSTYEKIRNVGIPCCRIVDSKTYNNNCSNGVRNLADKSILMQLGYNVNQIGGLSERTRHKILAMIIDEGILSKGEIIGYLDFFISQRQFDSKYELAISKWETDANFVRDYREGEYKKIGVNAIYRR